MIRMQQNTTGLLKTVLNTVAQSSGNPNENAVHWRRLSDCAASAADVCMHLAALPATNATTA